MHVDTIHEQLDAPVTRRRIVKTGVKLAYVAPIVAASFKLSGGATLAASPVACSGGSCGNSPLCETASGLCVCFQIPETNNPGFCHRCEQCGTAKDCDPSNQSSCPSGHVCSANNCCGVAKCLQPCSGTSSNCVNPPSSAEVRVYDVAALSSDSTEVCDQTVCDYLV